MRVPSLCGAVLLCLLMVLATPASAVLETYEVEAVTSDQINVFKLGKNGLALMEKTSNSPTPVGASRAMSLVGLGQINFEGSVPKEVSTKGPGSYPWTMFADRLVNKTFRATDVVFSTGAAGSAPNKHYWSDTANKEFFCDPVFLNGFKCYNKDRIPLATFDSVNVESPSIVRVVVEDQGDPVVFVALAAHRSLMWRGFVDTGTTIIDEHDERKTEAKLALGFIFLFVAIAMLSILLLVALFSGWLLNSEKFSPLQNFVHWAIGLFILQQVLSLAGGFPGWTLALITLVWTLVMCCCGYGCARRKAASSVAPAKDVESAPAPAEGEDGPIPESKGWTRAPKAFGKAQKACLFCNLIVIVASLILAIAVFYGWDPPQYRIWDRTLQEPHVEFAPSTVGKTTLLMYAHNGMATTFRFNIFAVLTTDWCDYWYNRPLGSNKEKQIKTNFIDKYNIDMTQYARPNWQDYLTVNDWFTRGLAPGVRPIAGDGDPDIAVSPADCRLTVFYNLDIAATIWLKNEGFSAGSLLGDDILAKHFAKGSMLIARLAPADYHRFHSPVEATVGTWKKHKGTLLSVNSDAVRSGNNVLLNTRLVSVFDSPSFGKVAYVAIGATCVGSVTISANATDASYVQKGDEVGTMAFGGSTVVILFQENAITFDDDLVYNSNRALETRILMGHSVGKRGFGARRAKEEQEDEL